MHSTDSELLDVVDMDDQVIGQETRKRIHSQFLLHRSVHVFVFSSSGDIYIQRRSPNKDRHPGLLDSSAAGHVDSGEMYDEAARRELQEELGVSGNPEPVLKVKACPETDNEHVQLYRIITGAELTPNPDEIQWGGFIHLSELLSRMRENPTDFVPAFVLLLHKYLEVEE